ncbi:MAG: site-specific DNA-methyltransferase [Rubrivivax sp.]|nr:MAG: site-specific DNA-methyltransferase [Rubrivivax sp.]
MPTLSWLTRDEDLKTAGRAPYRLLTEDPSLGYGDPDTGNMLIQGDNLEALKALLPFYAGRVKCIYIDPPYNTRSAFEHYDDNLEHSRWLAMMWPRLELLRELLSEDGSIWVSIDDNEGHYLKVIMDEVFGRANFVANVVWQKSYTANQTAKHLSDTHDHLLVYGRAADRLSMGSLSRTEDQKASFKNPDGDPRGPWKAENLSAGKFYSDGQFEIEGPNGDRFLPPTNRYWRCNRATYDRWLADGRITFGLKGTGRPMLKKYLEEMEDALTATTWWPHQEVGSNKVASTNLKALFPGMEVFGTPKPEQLLERVASLATNPGDLVLDSFLGSGTTAAVAQKMGRRYIGIEVGDHAVTHCAPRLQKVIDGEQGGISKSVGWTGGGGFRFYRLGEAVFGDDGALTSGIAFSTLAAHVWFAEIGHAPDRAPDGPLLGVREGRAVALLYNGVLGDKRPAGGNVLTRSTLAIIREALNRAAPGFDGRLTVYGERSALSPATLAAERIDFKQTPYDVKARR